MQGYRDDGVVLRTQKLGEADRIITLLTRHNGRVRAVAKGVRRTKSRFGARLEPFTHVDVMIHSGRSLDVITQAEVMRAYGTPLVSDYPKYTAGTAMLETAERLTPVEKEPAIRQFLLLIGGLRALGDAGEPSASADGGNPGDFGDLRGGSAARARLMTQATARCLVTPVTRTVSLYLATPVAQGAGKGPGERPRSADGARRLFPQVADLRRLRPGPGGVRPLRNPRHGD